MQIAALLVGEFAASQADRIAGVWRPGVVRRTSAIRPTPPRDEARAAQRRAVRLARAGRLSAAARALRADPPAPQTPAVERKALALFPPCVPGLATPATVEASFATELDRATAHGRRSSVPAAVPWDAAVQAIRSAPH